MDKKTYTLEVISPMLCVGADPDVPEIRAASIRGQLRYWLRAIIGTQTTDLTTLWKCESEVFGSTEAGSKIALRVYPTQVLRGESEILPHRDKKPKVPMPTIKINSKATLELVSRHGSIHPLAIHALHVWALLGGLGKRSRRMFGAFVLSGSGAPSYSSVDELKGVISSTLTSAISAVKEMEILKDTTYNSEDTIPEFPTLHPSHSRIIVGTKSYSDYRIAVVELFKKLLRTNKFVPNQDTFGSEDPRRASPLIAQLRRINGRYYPVLTALRSNPSSLHRKPKQGKSRPPLEIKWDVLKEFMKDAAEFFAAGEEKVWGDWS